MKHRASALDCEELYRNASSGITDFHLTAGSREDTQRRLCGSVTRFVTPASIHPRFLLRVTQTLSKEDSRRILYDHCTYLIDLDVHKLQIRTCYSKPNRVKDKEAQSGIIPLVLLKAGAG
jgi:hypothetical protein